LIELRESHILGGRTSSGDPQAWKKLIGNRPVAARLETLPENKIRRSAFAISSTTQLVLAMVVVALPLFFPERLSLRMVYQVTPIEAPQTEVPVPEEHPAVRPKRESAPVQPIEPVRVAKIFAPPPLIAPKPKPLERQNSEIPKLEPVLAPAKFDTSTAQPERPREPVKTGLLNTGSAAEPSLKAGSEKIQTGGFGDPNGFASDTAAKRGDVARLGSFELPSGPGYGNGTGGANGLRGTVASAGFGNGVAASAAASAKRGAVQSGGFGSVEVAPAAKSAPKQSEGAPAIQPVVILSKPNALYSDEGRKLGIEGEVLVEVIFQASGQVQTVRVVKGLGHGLDESARHAAEQIRFKPALQEGHAVDFPAIAHIVFQLAF
jgi:TonB family protein